MDGRDADGVQQMRQRQRQQDRRTADGPHGVLVPSHDVPPPPPSEARDVATTPDVAPEEVQAADRGQGGQFRQNGRRGEGALDLHEPDGLDVGVLEGPASDGHEDRAQDAEQDGAQDEHRRQREDGEVVAGSGPGPGIGGELRQGGGVRFPRGDLEVGRHFGYGADGIVYDVGFHGVLSVGCLIHVHVVVRPVVSPHFTAACTSELPSSCSANRQKMTKVKHEQKAMAKNLS